MLKKTLVMVLVLVMISSLSGCTTKPAEVKTPDAPKPATADFKIGIMTGTVAQNEEEFRMAERMQAKYGKDKILTQTYPTNFTQEQETIITNMMTFAADPKVKAIVAVQAVAGTAAAVDKVKAVRPDILFVLGTPGEDPDLVATKGDVVFQVNDLARGAQIAEQAKKLGAKKLIHYSFPRHLGNKMIAARRELMMAKCKELGIEFIDVAAPDPMAEGGIPATQLFINEDVPKQIKAHGKDTAFFGTNCSMQEPMISQIMAGGAIYPVQCCPSPYHALPAALQIKIPEDKKGDITYAVDQIRAKLKEKSMEKRVSTWPAPVNMLYIEAGVEYAMKFAKGETNGKKFDADVLKATVDTVSKKALTLTNYKSATGTTHPHYFLVLSEFIDFSK